jgi:hypothetical protein
MDPSRRGRACFRSRSGAAVVRAPPGPTSTLPERGYFSTNAPRLRYPTFRRAKLPIGSGAVEASAKHLVQQRMKRAGSRWSDLGACAILDLRCHGLSGRSLDSLA